jgi:hypothetical protein
MKALGLGVALMLVATVASAQDQPGPAPDAFRVTWRQETDPVARRIEGRVHNESPFRVTDVRLQIEGLDADRRAVGWTFAWAVGDLAPGGETSFVFDALPGAVSYRFAVVSYDVVSGPAGERR